MVLVGLTGGIGSGKSTVARRLADHGALLIDADRLARAVLEPGTPGLTAVVARFGHRILTPSGTLDRAALGETVFADDQARADLEQITHPLIRAATQEALAGAPPEAVVVHDVPLLVERDLSGDYDLVVVVGASPQTRMRRLAESRGMSVADAQARMQAQASDEQRRRVADVWIDNDDGPDRLREQVDRLWDRLRDLAVSARR